MGDALGGLGRVVPGIGLCIRYIRLFLFSKLYLDVKLVTIPFDRAYPRLLKRPNASKPLSALFSLRWPSEAVRGWGHMPCATTRPCSEELARARRR